MDLILRNARPLGATSTQVDIGIDKGRIVAMEPNLSAEGQALDLEGRIVIPGLIETHTCFSAFISATST